jgi:hypothetical protein
MLTMPFRGRPVRGLHSAHHRTGSRRPTGVAPFQYARQIGSVWQLKPGRSASSAGGGRAGGRVVRAQDDPDRVGTAHADAKAVEGRSGERPSTPGAQSVVGSVKSAPRNRIETSGWRRRRCGRRSADLCAGRERADVSVAVLAAAHSARAFPACASGRQRNRRSGGSELDAGGRTRCSSTTQVGFATA